MNIKSCRQLQIAPRHIFIPIIWVTNRCNLRCKMCDQWKTSQTLLSKELTTKEWYSFVDSAVRLNAALISITGGEPFLRKDIFDIIKYVNKKKIASHLCSNGTLLNEQTVNKIKDSGLNSISISLDSDCADIHNEMRGDDCFYAVIRGISLLKLMAPRIKIGLNCVITKHNFRGIYKMVNFAESLGVNQIKFDLIHTNLVHRKKNISTFNGCLFNKDDMRELLPEIDKLADSLSKTKLIKSSRTFINGMLAHISDEAYMNFPCYSGYISCTVDALGWVSPCDEFDGLENIRDKPFEEIWNSQSFQRLRQRAHNCKSRCLDTTHAEINIRCSIPGIMNEFAGIIKETAFYF